MRKNKTLDLGKKIKLVLTIVGFIDARHRSRWPAQSWNRRDRWKGSLWKKTSIGQKN